MRIDKYLKNSRLIKRRTVAKEACDQERILINGKVAKAGSEVKEGDEIEAGSLTFTVIECPGHTPGGLTYMIERCLFTGDTLFRMSCGRYDFPASSSVELTLSLSKLRDLEGDYEVYPGHESPTTMEFERRFNPYVLQPWNL